MVYLPGRKECAFTCSKNLRRGFSKVWKTGCECKWIENVKRNEFQRKSCSHSYICYYYSHRPWMKDYNYHRPRNIFAVIWDRIRDMGIGWHNSTTKTTWNHQKDPVFPSHHSESNFCDYFCGIKLNCTIKS